MTFGRKFLVLISVLMCMLYSCKKDDSVGNPRGNTNNNNNPTVVYPKVYSYTPAKPINPDVVTVYGDFDSTNLSNYNVYFQCYYKGDCGYPVTSTNNDYSFPLTFTKTDNSISFPMPSDIGRVPCLFSTVAVLHIEYLDSLYILPDTFRLSRTFETYPEYCTSGDKIASDVPDGRTDCVFELNGIATTTSYYWIKGNYHQFVYVVPSGLTEGVLDIKYVFPSGSAFIDRSTIPVRYTSKPYWYHFYPSTVSTGDSITLSYNQFVYADENNYQILIHQGGPTYTTISASEISVKFTSNVRRLKFKLPSSLSAGTYILEVVKQGSSTPYEVIESNTLVIQ